MNMGQVFKIVIYVKNRVSQPGSFALI